jgi:hypothetical protein
LGVSIGGAPGGNSNSACGWAGATDQPFNANLWGIPSDWWVTTGVMLRSRGGLGSPYDDAGYGASVFYGNSWANPDGSWSNVNFGGSAALYGRDDYYSRFQFGGNVTLTQRFANGGGMGANLNIDSSGKGNVAIGYVTVSGWRLELAGTYDASINAYNAGFHAIGPNGSLDAYVGMSNFVPWDNGALTKGPDRVCASIAWHF